MHNLILVIIILLALSFLCSLLEAVILSIRRPFIHTLIDQKKVSGEILRKLRDNIDEPIAAILTLNTVAHTMGAAVAGIIAFDLFGSAWMGLFSAVLTLLILVLSEIIPKTIGARNWKLLSHPTAYILRFMVFILKPLIVPMNYLSKAIAREDQGEHVSKEEIFNFIRMGYDQGVIEHSEFRIIENFLRLRDVRVRDIMTPRTVVESLDPDLKLAEISGDVSGLNFSRIPLYKSSNNRIYGLVRRRELVSAVNGKKHNKTLRSLGKKPEYLPDSMQVLKLMNWFIRKGVHLGFVLNEYGDYVGIVTIEDAIETLLGVEIVDEYDPAPDMRTLAAQKMTAGFPKNSGNKG